VQGVLPNADAPGDEIRDFFADDRGAIMAGVWLRFLAGFAFVWFLGTLRSALRRAEDRTGQALAFGYRIASRSAIACQPGRTAPAYVRA